MKNIKKFLNKKFITGFLLTLFIAAVTIILVYLCGNFSNGERSEILDMFSHIDTAKYTRIKVILYALVSVTVAFLTGCLCAFGKGVFGKYDKGISVALAFLFPLFIGTNVALVKINDYKLVNILMITAFYMFMFIITQRSSIAAIVTAFIVCFFTIANECVIKTRGMAISISDFYAIATGLTVVSTYRISINLDMIYSFVSFLLVVLLAIHFPFKAEKKKLIIAIPLAVCMTVSSVILSYNMILNKKAVAEDLASQDLSNNKGVFYNLANKIINTKLEKPEHYSKKDIEKSLSSYSPDKDPDQYPNVIFIVNESFADLRELYDLTTDKPLLPYLDSLKETSLHGHMVPSVYGGSTCNTEFELMTGLSMVFLPEGSFPFMQYLVKPIDTYISDAPDVYQKIYMHPYIADNWKRNEIYKFLGFDSFIAGKDFVTEKGFEESFSFRVDFIDYPGVDKVRGYISDKAVSEKIIELYKNKPSDKKLMVQAMTMQNHGSYQYSKDDFKNEIHAENGSDELDQFLTLTHISDEAMKLLVEYFKTVDEPTVIAFVGDHEPNISDPGDIHFKEVEPTNTIHDFYVPYFVWTNYDNPLDSAPELISANYFSLILKKSAGLPLNSFDKFREELFNKYPVFTPKVVIDSEGNECKPSQAEDKALDTYNNIQYSRMFE